MDNLQQLSEQLNHLSQSLQAVRLPMANGVTTLSSHIESVKRAINENNTYLFGDESYFHSVKGQKQLLDIQSQITLNVKEHLEAFIHEDDFHEQWNMLDDESKKEFIYFDQAIYPILRQKLGVAEFNFMFHEFEDIQISTLNPLLNQWITAPDGAKVIFYKLRKEAQDTPYESFFNDSKTVAAEKNGSSSTMRERLVVEYLRNPSKNPEPFISWYDRLDMNHNKNWAFGYTYHFLKDMEDEFNGYAKLKNKIELPLVLKKWAGMDFDFEAHQKAIEAFEKSLEGANKATREKRMHEHPQILLEQQIQLGLSLETLSNLKDEAKGTFAEAFFNLPLTEQMRTSMPYRRIDYMWVYFREEFMNVSVKRPKP